MNDWRVTTIDDIAARDRYSVAGGPFGSALGRKDYVSMGVPVIRGAQLGGPSAFSHDDLVFVSDEKADRHAGNLAYPGDVLMTQRGTVGQVGRIPADVPYPRYLLSQSQMKLTVDPSKADASFVYYALLAPVSQDTIRGSTISAGVPHINLATFRALKLSVPSLRTQRRIGSILRAIDDLIENSRRRIELLERMARAIYQEWFVGFRYPGYENSALAGSPLGPIPEGWDVKTLGAFVDVDKGLSYKGAYLTDDGVPMANLKCFRPGGGFRRDGTKPYSGSFKKKHEVKPGDLIVANTDLTQAGSVIGSPALVPRRGFETGGIVSHHLFAVRCSDESLIPWLYQVFRDEPFRSFARGVASGTTVLGFRPADLLSFQLACPPPEVWRLFSALAGDLHTMTEDLNDACDELGAIRDLLLPKLVTGQIDVSNVDLDMLVDSVA